MHQPPTHTFRIQTQGQPRERSCRQKRRPPPAECNWDLRKLTLPKHKFQPGQQCRDPILLTAHFCLAEVISISSNTLKHTTNVYTDSSVLPCWCGGPEPSNHYCQHFYSRPWLSQDSQMLKELKDRDIKMKRWYQTENMNGRGENTRRSKVIPGMTIIRGLGWFLPA